MIRFAATVLYVDDVAGTLAFYERAFGTTPRFHDKTFQFAEIEVHGTVLSFAAHSVGEFPMPDAYVQPANGGPAAVELAFLTEDVPSAFAKVVARRVVRRWRSLVRCLGARQWRTCVLRRVR
ncbi:MAG: VOC family protein [Acidobacteria bacterium]|nr:VOC family protein [Acidobacteriota bacterium]